MNDINFSDYPSLEEELKNLDLDNYQGVQPSKNDWQLEVAEYEYSYSHMDYFK